MSDTDKTKESTHGAEDASMEPEAEPTPEVETEIESAPEAEVEPGPESEPESQADDAPVTDIDTKPSKKRGGGAVAWLALFLSLVTLAALGYLIFEDWRAKQLAAAREDPIAALTSRFTASEQSLSSLDQGLTELVDADAQVTAELEAVKRAIDVRLQLVDTLPKRMSSLENSVASLQGISAGARNTWLLAEAEYYMQIANAQLQLAGNPELAALALGMADERVTRIGDPGLTEVRRAIADELAALEVMEKPDIEGVTLTLASLARVVNSLPLKRMAESKAAETDTVDAELSGVDRAWASVKGALSGLVKVTPPDQAEMPLITPDAVYFLRTNLTLQLQAARLALLRGEQAVFQQSLNDAKLWLEQYFDANSEQVSSALDTIDEIRAGMFTVTSPDISQSLRLVRQFRTLSESAQ